MSLLRKVLLLKYCLSAIRKETDIYYNSSLLLQSLWCWAFLSFVISRPINGHFCHCLELGTAQNTIISASKYILLDKSHWSWVSCKLWRCSPSTETTHRKERDSDKTLAELCSITSTGEKRITPQNSSSKYNIGAIHSVATRWHCACRKRECQPLSNLEVRKLIVSWVMQTVRNGFFPSVWDSQIMWGALTLPMIGHSHSPKSKSSCHTRLTVNPSFLQQWKERPKGIALWPPNGQGHVLLHSHTWVHTHRHTHSHTVTTYTHTDTHTQTYTVTDTHIHWQTHTHTFTDPYTHRLSHAYIICKGKPF
jgi:hypothetical protein